MKHFKPFYIEVVVNGEMYLFVFDEQTFMLYDLVS